jgi:hypothetical protein
VDGHTKEVTVDPQGNLFKAEEQVQPDSPPANVLNDLCAQPGKSSITKIKSLMKHSKIVAYEAQIVYWSAFRVTAAARVLRSI